MTITCALDNLDIGVSVKKTFILFLVRSLVQKAEGVFFIFSYIVTAMDHAGIGPTCVQNFMARFSTSKRDHTDAVRSRN